MRDDEFQLPVVAARYLTNPAVSAARKLAFLMDSSDGRGPRVALLLRELALVSTLAAPYGRDPTVQNLIGSPRLDSTHWRSISWRDSNAGYANGRFAMDINAIWVPRALESTSEIIAALRKVAFTPAQKSRLAEVISGTPLEEFVHDPALLQRAVDNWNGAEPSLRSVTEPGGDPRQSSARSFSRFPRRSARIGRACWRRAKRISSRSSSLRSHWTPMVIPYRS